MTDLRVRKGQPLPPFDAASLCPKCGHDDIGARHVPACGCSRDDCKGEHIARNCRRCQFEWAEGALS